MAEEEIQESVPGYSGSPHEGQRPSEPPEGVEVVHENAVVSNVGVTEPTAVFKGDGVTPADAEIAPLAAHPQTEEAEKEAPEGSVISPAGVTPPTLVYQGDGVTLVGEEKASSNGTEESEARNYDDFTVAELKDQAESRGVELKSDWNKSEIIKALKKADKAEGG